jgi:hypothetical protein
VEKRLGTTVLDLSAECKVTISKCLFVTEAVMNLYLDWHKHKGVNVKGKLPQLESILNSNYSLDNVIQFFDL